MVFAFNPDCVATSTNCTPKGVPAMGDCGPGGGGIGLASYERSMPPGFCWACCVAASATRFQGGVAIHSTSENGRTSAVLLRDCRNRRRFIESMAFYFLADAQYSF